MLSHLQQSLRRMYNTSLINRRYSLSLPKNLQEKLQASGRTSEERQRIKRVKGTDSYTLVSFVH